MCACARVECWSCMYLVKFLFARKTNINSDEKRFLLLFLLLQRLLMHFKKIEWCTSMDAYVLPTKCTCTLHAIAQVYECPSAIVSLLCSSDMPFLPHLFTCSRIRIIFRLSLLTSTECSCRWFWNWTMWSNSIESPNTWFEYTNIFFGGGQKN